VGFRTSPGRVPKVPSRDGWNALNVVGPMARTVEDLALFLSAIAGPDPRAPLSIHEPGARFAHPLARDCKGLRIAWCDQFAGLPFDTRVSAVVNARRRTFEDLGCVTEDADPDFSGADEAFKTLRALGFYLQHGELLEPHRAQMKRTVIDEIERGARLTGPQIARAETLRSQLFERIGEFMTRFDFLVLPVVQVPPFDIDQEYVTEIDGQRLETYVDWMRSCYYISSTALPAISVPAGFTPEGLPVGLQIVGRHQDDWGVLQVAYAFEQAAGIRERPALAQNGN
jgi:amidase